MRMLVVLLLLWVPGFAQEPLTLLGVDSGQTTTATTTFGANIDFRIGRDNFAFPNLSGAVRTAGMSGNCYAMAACAKLFFERVRFEAADVPDAQRRGFDTAALSAHLASGSGRFVVRDYSSLFDMTNDASFDEAAAMAYARRSMGLDGGAAGALAGRPKMISQTMQLVSTVHYTHYMQIHAPDFLGPAVGTLLRSGSAAEVTRRSVAGVKAQLSRGKTTMVALWNSAVVFGHVVLAYRVEAAQDWDDVYVYDSNVQHGAERGETILRIGRDGRLATMKKAVGGAPAADGIYDGVDWYQQRDTLCLVQLSDDADAGDNLRLLSDRLARTDLTTVYLTSVHGLLQSLTEQDPATRSLRDDVRTFLLEVQTVQQAAGDATIQPGERLTSTSGALEINRLLSAHADLAVRTVVPHALPPGLALTGTTLLLHRSDPNLAYLDTTLSIRPGSPVKELVRALGDSAMLAGQTALFDWLQTAERLVGDLAVSAHVKTLVRKQAMPGGFKTRFGLIPDVQALHATFGDIAPAATPDHPFQVEIAKPVLQRALALLLERTDALDRSIPYDRGDARIEAVSLELAAGSDGRPGQLVVTSKLRTFTRVLGERGVTWNADPLTASFEIYRYRSRNMAPNRWLVHGRLDGRLAASDGVGNIAAGTLADIATAAFPAFRDTLNGFIAERLAGVLRFVDGLEIKDLAVGVSTLTAQTGEASVDLERLGQTAFGAPFPVEVRQVRVVADRLVLGGTR